MSNIWHTLDGESCPVCDEPIEINLQDNSQPKEGDKLSCTFCGCAGHYSVDKDGKGFANMYGGEGIGSGY